MSDEFGQGWVNDPEAVEAVLSTLPFPVVSGATADEFAGSGVGKDVFFWEAEQIVLGRRLNAWNQKSVGSCVSFGWGRAAQDLMLAEIAGGESEEWPGAEVATEPIYGGSRVEIGGGKIRGDGSVGAWGGDYVSRFGLLFRQKYGSIDLSEYDEDRCRQYGKSGVPDELEPIARQHPIKTISLVETVEQLRDGIANGYPCSLCGSLGRNDRKGNIAKRQPGGWCPVGGTWNHCQEIRGVCVVKGGRPAFVYQNSWGDYLGDLNNKVQLESGREIVLPQGCYLSEYDDVRRELKQRDTFLASGFVGFPKRELSWVP